MAAKTKKTVITRTSALKAKPAGRTVQAPRAAQVVPTSQARPATISKPALEQMIRDRAYYIYLNRGCSQGVCATQDWYEAEKQIKKELGIR